MPIQNMGSNGKGKIFDPIKDITLTLELPADDKFGDKIREQLKTFLLKEGLRGHVGWPENPKIPLNDLEKLDLRDAGITKDPFI